MIEDVLLQAGSLTDRFLPSQPGPIHGTFDANPESGLRPPYPGVMARPVPRLDAARHGPAARLALLPDPNNVLRVNGLTELTAQNYGFSLARTHAALNGHTCIEIDLSDTSVMDCSGLGALIALRNCARRRNGVVRLVSPIPAVRRLLEIVRAEQMFEIVQTVGFDPIARNQPGA